MTKIGFIGCGNMAQAIISGIISSGKVSPDNIIASDINNETLSLASEKLAISVTSDNSFLIQSCDIVFLAVKPQFLDKALEEIGSVKDKLIISIVAGRSLSHLASFFPEQTAIIRTMPNTPALVGEGMTSVTPNEFVSPEQLKIALELLSSFSKTEVVSECLIDAVVGVSGSSPAYVFMLIEAMADAAVEAGLPRSQAYSFAAQAVYGSAKMVLETGKHPAELKDMVCSPGGTTIEAIRVLEEKGFRAAVIDAIKACVEKSKNL